MSMLERIRKLLGGAEVPEEVTSFYRGARTEREALIMLREARRRDEARRRRATKDIDALDELEKELLEEGRNETSEAKKVSLARRIKEVRGRMQEINNRVENIYNKRIRIFSEHLQSLETVLELTSEPLPDRKEMEDAAIQARTMLEDLDHARETAEGISQSAEAPELDSEEKKILQEFEQASEAPPIAESVEAEKDRELEEEEIKLPEKKKEKPKKEPPRRLLEE